MLTLKERAVLEQVDFTEPMLLLNTFKNLNRLSGSEDEKKAAFYVAERLQMLGIPYEILRPEIFLSIPQKAELKIIGLDKNIKAKTPSYSMSTGDKWVDGELIFASSYRPPLCRRRL